MLNSFRIFQSLLHSHGARWLLFRVGYALRIRTGLVRLQMPVYAWEARPLGTWLKKNIPSKPEAYSAWRKQHALTYFFSEIALPEKVPWDPQVAVDEAERILSGEIKYFSHRFLKTGFPPDWHADPVSGIRLDSKKHWSEISDDGEVDIKFIWEANRFSMVYALVRAYASLRDERFAEAFWELVQTWAESNPPNTGPNWMDGQEVALRLMAWTFGYYAFMNSPSATPERIAQFTVLVAAQAERIHRNIAYAISTHSNHTISEAFGLWLVGLLFPELKDSETYLRLGQELLEREASAQMFADGTYSMYSLNYHRFIVHIYLYALRLGQLNNSPLSESVYRVVKSSVDYLYQIIDPASGQMPVYGSNDGALVLPLSNCDFTDYRPLLQLGSYLTKSELLFEPGPWDEDIFWLCGGKSPSPRGRRSSDDGKSSFPIGGIYILRGANSKAVIRCTDYRARPSHADQLHVDLWWRGHNIACDAETYLYSGKGVWRNGLAHTSVHNTVTVDSQDQMKMVSRFTWTNWSRGKALKHDSRTWQGAHDGYRRLSDPVTHKRTVLSLDEDRWLVVDDLDAKQSHRYALHWLLNDFPFEQQGSSIFLAIDSMRYKIQMGGESESSFSVVRGDENSTRGWCSRYYGHKEPAISVTLETHQPRARLWTFFGFESDSIQLTGETLRISSPTWETSIDLRNPVSDLQ
ncbi:MAG TPA: alginate lyase family protein [Anaerolineales bacterium]|nr:alginate lyase family protein [Anaerolineales bacterium]